MSFSNNRMYTARITTGGTGDISGEQMMMVMMLLMMKLEIGSPMRTVIIIVTIDPTHK